MTDPLSQSITTLSRDGPPLAELVATQPLAFCIVAFVLLYALLTLCLRLADRFDPPAAQAGKTRRGDPPAPKVWRYRKPA